MQLNVARLCLECEEVHEAWTCPRCTSETFAYLSRWIPVPERRARPRSEETQPKRVVVAAENKPVPSRGRWLKRGALLAVVGLGGWLWSQHAAKPAPRSDTPTRE
jgi:hypothetical protein